MGGAGLDNPASVGSRTTREGQLLLDDPTFGEGSAGQRQQRGVDTEVPRTNPCEIAVGEQATTDWRASSTMPLDDNAANRSVTSAGSCSSGSGVSSEASGATRRGRSGRPRPSSADTTTAPSTAPRITASRTSTPLG